MRRSARGARLRIIAGEFGGRYIHAPPGRGTRPTRSRVREAWFSALAAEVPGARAADLFAGSGALGIEALSRGARHVCFVESHPRAAAILAGNLRALGVGGRARVVRGDALAWIERLEAPLDLVLADPPYDAPEGGLLLELFLSRPFARQLWIEHAPKAAWALGADWSRAYGDARVSAWRAAQCAA